MPLDEQVIQNRIQSCPRLGSLRRINTTFQDLANADQDYTGQIAEIIRRDPSLTSRLLQMVNSVFYGLREKVSSVEDAVFYLGTKQIKQMALATPVLEDMQRFTSGVQNVDWPHFWQQSIGCAIMTRELLSFSSIPAKGDADYISGLIYGVGYLVSVAAFPEQMSEIFGSRPETEEEIESLQKELIGWSQPEIGSFFLESNNIPEPILTPVKFQTRPEDAEEAYKRQSAAVYIAKRMIGELQSGTLETEIKPDVETTPLPDLHSEPSSAYTGPYRIPMTKSPAWDLCPELHLLLSDEAGDTMFTVSSLRYTLSQIPAMLNGLV